MSARTRTRIAVASGAALLCAGVSVPAAAHGTDHPTEAVPTAHVKRLSFAQLKEFALRQLDREASWLTALKAKVAADPRLSAAQQAAFTAKLDKALAAVTAARTAVQAATTTTALKAALRSALVPLEPYPRYHVIAHRRHHVTKPQHHRTAPSVTFTAARVNDPNAVRAHRTVAIGRHCAGRHGTDPRFAAYRKDRSGWSGRDSGWRSGRHSGDRWGSPHHHGGGHWRGHWSGHAWAAG